MPLSQPGYAIGVARDAREEVVQALKKLNEVDREGVSEEKDRSARKTVGQLAENPERSRRQDGCPGQLP